MKNAYNTSAMEYDYSEPVPDFNFIENELNNPSLNRKYGIIL